MVRQPHQIHEFPKSRFAIIDAASAFARKHLMYSLLEVDVTEARRKIRQLKQAGHRISFTAWMLKAIGNAVDRNKAVHAVRLGKRKLVIFDEVDIGLPVERTVEGEGVPLVVRIDSVNSKTVEQIEDELQAAVGQTVEDEQDYVLNENRVPKWLMKAFYNTPSFLRVLLLKRMFANPFRAKANAGTITATTVNAIGRVSGWILPTRSMHNLLFAFGSVNEKPWVVDGEIVVRDILHLTVAFDHDVIDGMPARRFVDDLVRHVEKGTGG